MDRVWGASTWSPERLRGVAVEGGRRAEECLSSKRLGTRLGLKSALGRRKAMPLRLEPDLINGGSMKIDRSELETRGGEHFLGSPICHSLLLSPRTLSSISPARWLILRKLWKCGDGSSIHSHLFAMVASHIPSILGTHHHLKVTIQEDTIEDSQKGERICPAHGL